MAHKRTFVVRIQGIGPGIRTRRGDGASAADAGHRTAGSARARIGCTRAISSHGSLAAAGRSG